MSHRFTRLRYHLVWSTKERLPALEGEWLERTHAYLGGVVRNLKGNLIEISGVADHAHLLVELPPTITIADAIMKLKANSSKWLNETAGFKLRFAWQEGYSAFTVGETAVDGTVSYIRAQAEHHKKHSFTDELRDFCRRHDLPFRDEDLR